MVDWKRRTHGTYVSDPVFPVLARPFYGMVDGGGRNWHWHVMCASDSLRSGWSRTLREAKAATAECMDSMRREAFARAELNDYAAIRAAGAAAGEAARASVDSRARTHDERAEMARLASASALGVFTPRAMRVAFESAWLAAVRTRPGAAEHPPGETRFYLVNADHASPAYAARARAVRVDSDGRGGFYADAEPYGMGKTRFTPADAIRSLLGENACFAIVVAPRPYHRTESARMAADADAMHATAEAAARRHGVAL